MQFIAVLNDQQHPIDVPDSLLTEAEAFFAKMDADMDKGYQMSRTWTDKLDTVHRCQVAADKILGALETNNPNLAAMMAGYILSRAPSVTGVYLDTSGDMREHELIVRGQG